MNLHLANYFLYFDLVVNYLGVLLLYLLWTMNHKLNPEDVQACPCPDFLDQIRT